MTNNFILLKQLEESIEMKYSNDLKQQQKLEAEEPPPDFKMVERQFFFKPAKSS